MNPQQQQPQSQPFAQYYATPNSYQHQQQEYPYPTYQTAPQQAYAPTVYQEVSLSRNSLDGDEQAALIILIIGLLVLPLAHFANCGYLKSRSEKARTMARISMIFVGIYIGCALFSVVAFAFSMIMFVVFAKKASDH